MDRLSIPFNRGGTGLLGCPQRKYADGDENNEEDTRIKVELQDKIDKWKPVSMNLSSWAIGKSESELQSRKDATSEDMKEEATDGSN
mmetsp:Transcript_5964/g.16701  ORF Transcript_5964/g.16701 Transcript_5964/m.16701 type:complete len:87 (+) Transcript_5964:239-499(+)